MRAHLQEIIDAIHNDDQERYHEIMANYHILESSELTANE